MEGRVSRTTDSHVDGNGVFKGFQGHDVARLDIFADQIHDDLAGFLSQHAAQARIGSGNGAVAGKAHAEDFGHAVHGVGCEQAGTGTAARAGLEFHLVHFFRCHLARFDFASGFKHGADADVLAVVTAGEHGAAADDDCRDVEAAGSHEHSRDDFIAVRDEYQAIKGMSCRYGFNGVTDQFTAGQGKAHAAMTHGDTVADADGREFNRCTAGSGNAELDCFGNIAQMDMAGNDFIEGITDTDQRFLQIFIAIAHSME